MDVSRGSTGGLMLSASELRFWGVGGPLGSGALGNLDILAALEWRANHLGFKACGP